MDALTDQVGEAWTAFTEHPVVQLALAGIGFYVVLLWLAGAVWAYNDMRRRHREPTLPYVVAAIVILASPVLFLLAIVVYRIVRPGETLSESRERQLNDRLLDLAAGETWRCPGCSILVEESWVVCPACRARLAHQCLGCGRSMGLDWTLCAWCGTEFGRPVIAEVLPRPQAEQPVPGLATEALPGVVRA